ncbi:MAG: amino acid ABC transporter permease [Caldilineaceae bacterium]
MGANLTPELTPGLSPEIVPELSPGSPPGSVPGGRRPPEILPPPVERYSVLGWLRKNLFQNWASTLATLVMAALGVWVVRGMLQWVLTGADWGVIVTNLQLLLIGQYPRDQVWRLWLVLMVMGVVAGLSWGVWVKYERKGATALVVGMPFLLALLPYDTQTRLLWASLGTVTLAAYLLGSRFPTQLRRAALVGWLAFIPVAMVLIYGLGDNTVLPTVATNIWGGLLLTLIIAGIGLTVSFPIGIVLAVGRRSKYPVIRAACIVYIELIRSVPLITVLFMAQTMIPLFLPDTISIDRVVRAIIAFTVFTAAYMAENVRGGLQAVPKGQYEAAGAVGLNGYQSMRLVILPQALRSIIPILTASIIAGFRDTSLVLILGLLDLLGIAKATLAQPAFLGRHIEVYSFLAAVYWFISYGISYVGLMIEERMGVSPDKR